MVTNQIIVGSFETINRMRIDIICSCWRTLRHAEMVLSFGCWWMADNDCLRILAFASNILRILVTQLVIFFSASGNNTLSFIALTRCTSISGQVDEASGAKKYQKFFTLYFGWVFSSCNDHIQFDSIKFTQTNLVAITSIWTAIIFIFRKLTDTAKKKRNGPYSDSNGFLSEKLKRLYQMAWALKVKQNECRNRVGERSLSSINY